MTKHELSQELKVLKRIEALLEVLAKNALADKLAKIYKDKKLAFLYENTGDIARP